MGGGERRFNWGVEVFIVVRNNGKGVGIGLIFYIVKLYWFLEDYFVIERNF